MYYYLEMKNKYKKVFSISLEPGYRNYTVKDIIDLKGKNRLDKPVYSLVSFEGDWFKENLLQNLIIKNDLYTKGWFYQQCLKIGANDIIKLPDNFMIWDADMLPVNPWPVSDNKFALLQDNSGGNPEIVKKWEIWIKKVLTKVWF